MSIVPVCRQRVLRLRTFMAERRPPILHLAETVPWGRIQLAPTMCKVDNI